MYVYICIDVCRVPVLGPICVLQMTLLINCLNTHCNDSHDKNSNHLCGGAISALLARRQNVRWLGLCLENTDPHHGEAVNTRHKDWSTGGAGMYTCIYRCICVYIYTHITYVHVCTCIHIHMYIYIYIYTYTCAYVLYTHIYVYTYKYFYTGICTLISYDLSIGSASVAQGLCEA